MDIHVYLHLGQGRLHPDDLQLIREGLKPVMAQIDDLMSDLNAITTDVANKISAHAQEVADLEQKLKDAQSAASSNQPVDLTEALALTGQLRSSLEQTASAATEASDSAQAVVDAAPSDPAPDTSSAPVGDVGVTAPGTEEAGNMGSPGTGEGGEPLPPAA